MPRFSNSHTRAEWIAKFEECGCKCYYCNVLLTLKEATKDHLTPRSRWGCEQIDNIVPACLRCNVRKGYRTEAEYRAHLPAYSEGFYESTVAFKASRGRVYLEELDQPGLTSCLKAESERGSWAWRNPPRGKTA